MRKPCNLRHQQLRQLEAEFTTLRTAGDLVRRKELAAEIVALRAEFGGSNPECERVLADRHA